MKKNEKLRRDICLMSAIIDTQSAILDELNTVTGNTTNSKHLPMLARQLMIQPRIVDISLTATDMAQIFSVATQLYNWSRAPEWANVLLCGNEVVVWAESFSDNANFIQFENFSKGHLSTFKLSLVEGHSWHLLAIRPTR